MSIEKNIKKIKEQIGNNNVEIIAVVKYASDEEVLKAYKAGLHNFGESYVQDAVKRINNLQLPENKVKWHFIGRLQKNKVKYAVGNFLLIHSVDSIELAEIISKVAEKKEIKQNILLQVNVLRDITKAGFTIGELFNSFEKIASLKNIVVQGLSTIAPLTEDSKIIKDCFNGLYNLKEELNKKFKANLKELSMGMSNDYKVAIECGATMIRLGRAIFKINTGG